jgi:hypothetical protein
VLDDDLGGLIADDASSAKRAVGKVIASSSRKASGIAGNGEARRTIDNAARSSTGRPVECATVASSKRPLRSMRKARCRLSARRSHDRGDGAHRGAPARWIPAQPCAPACHRCDSRLGTAPVRAHCPVPPRKRKRFLSGLSRRTWRLWTIASCRSRMRYEKPYTLPKGVNESASFNGPRQYRWNVTEPGCPIYGLAQ